MSQVFVNDTLGLCYVAIGLETRRSAVDVQRPGERSSYVWI